MSTPVVDYIPISMYGGARVKKVPRRIRGNAIVRRRRRKNNGPKVVAFTTTDGKSVGPFISNPHNKRSKGIVVGRKNVSFVTKSGKQVNFQSRVYSKSELKKDLLHDRRQRLGRYPGSSTSSSSQSGAGYLGEIGSGLRSVGTDLAVTAGKAAVHEAAAIAKRKMLALKNRFGSRKNRTSVATNPVVLIDEPM